MIILILSIVSAVLYRIGGKGGFRNAKLVRRLGCSLIALITLYLLGIRVEWWKWLLTFGFQFGALTTYHDYLTGGHEDWKCWAMTGFTYGMSAILFGPGHWIGFALRVIGLTIATTIWSELISQVDAEEAGRGFLFNITLKLLTLWPIK